MISRLQIQTSQSFLFLEFFHLIRRIFYFKIGKTQIILISLFVICVNILQQISITKSSTNRQFYIKGATGTVLKISKQMKQKTEPYKRLCLLFDLYGISVDLSSRIIHWNV